MDERDSPPKDRVLSVTAGSKDSIPALRQTRSCSASQFHCHNVPSYCQYNSTATTYLHTVNTIPLPQHTFTLSIQFHCHNIPSYCQYNSTATTYFHTVNTIPRPQHTFILSIQFHCHNIPSYCQYSSTATTYLNTVNTIPLPQYSRFTKGPQPLPKRMLHRGQFSAFAFNFHYPPIFFRSPISSLPLLRHHPTNSMHSSAFPSITCFFYYARCDQSS